MKLDALYSFCGERNGEIHVTTTDPQVAERLKKPGEARRLAPVIKPILAQPSGCGWLDNAQQKTQMEARLAAALTGAYQQAVGGVIAPLKVRLRIHPYRARLPGVMPTPPPSA